MENGEVVDWKEGIGLLLYCLAVGLKRLVSFTHSLLDDREVVMHSDLVLENCAELLQKGVSLLSAAQLFKHDSMISAGFPVNLACLQLLGRVMLALIASLLVVPASLIKLPSTVQNHRDVIVCLCELGPEKLTSPLLCRGVLEHGLLEVVESRVGILLQLQVKQAQVEVRFNISRVHSQNSLIRS